MAIRQSECFAILGLPNGMTADGSQPNPPVLPQKFLGFVG
jgi:hypothetical protein